MNELADLPGDASVVYRGETVFVTPDIAPIRDGHLLVIPYEHHLSTAQAAAAHGFRLYAELADISGWYERVFNGPPQMFEHGSVIEDKGGDLTRCGSCIDHAHIHLLPRGTIDEALAVAHLGAGVDASFEELARIACREPYVYAALGSTERVYHQAPPSRQLLRWLVGGGRLDRGSTWQARYRLASSRRSFAVTLRHAQGYR